jgi:hypothetical protein
MHAYRRRWRLTVGHQRCEVADELGVGEGRVRDLDLLGVSSLRERKLAAGCKAKAEPVRSHTLIARRGLTHRGDNQSVHQS